VWKSKAQTVTWFSDDSDYRIHFMGVNGSPFTGANPLVLPANGSVPSGALRGNVAPGYNEYTLENSSGTPCNTVGDPGIYVK